MLVQAKVWTWKEALFLKGPPQVTMGGSPPRIIPLDDRGWQSLEVSILPAVIGHCQPPAPSRESIGHGPGFARGAKAT